MVDQAVAVVASQEVAVAAAAVEAQEDGKKETNVLEC